MATKRGELYAISNVFTHMHNLTPEFILQKLAQHEVQGQFAAVVLFVDTSGFTPLTTTLLQHGTEGAEIIAQVLANLFTPLVEIVYRHSGFIAGFAGDAFKAIFPGTNAATYQHALTAAWQIRQHLAAHPMQQTRFGDFPFALKVTVADGSVEWWIWQSEETTATSAQQAAALFGGPALAQALAADPFAKAGEVVLTPTVAAQVRQDGVLLEPADNHFRLCAWTIVPERPHLSPTASTLALPLTELATRFFPAELLTRQLQGEFRRVVTVFINVAQLPNGAAASTFAATLFRLLAQYGGYLCRIGQIGDQDHGGTLLLFWGAPTSHEQDVVRALHFVLALQAAAPMRLRAGITTQLAYAGFVGAPQREEYTCYGPHINLAARQMVLAGWDELWLDEETTRLAGATFVCARQDAFRFKGFAEERVVYRLLGPQENVGLPFYQGALVGRQAELVQLTTALAPLAEGKFAGVLTISGEAGIGKSRLVYELQQQLTLTSEQELSCKDDKVTRWQGDEVKEPASVPVLPSLLHLVTSSQWFLCQTDEILRQPLNPFRYWLRSYFNQSASADEAANKAAFSAKLDELLVRLGTSELVGQKQSKIQNLKSEIARTRSFLGALVDLHWPDSLYAQVEPQLRFENTLAALKTLILAESLRRPVIIHLEDAHWLDADSHTLLARLTHQVADFPLAIIMTRRPGASTGGQGDTRQEEEEADRLALAGPRLLLRLTTLTVEEIRELAAVQLQGAPAPALVTLIEERAEGNPFFAEQLLRYLHEQAWLVQDVDGWQLRPDQAASTLLPSGARALLVARLDRLPQPVKEVVQTAAVLGREFDTNVLAQMLADDQTLAAKLVAADRAAIWSAISQARYLFRHALLREAAYDMQLRARLRTLHRRAGAALEQLYTADLTPYFGELAYHYDRAEMMEQAALWYSRAGEQAAASYANAEAVRYFTRALACTPAGDLAMRYRCLLGREQVYEVQSHRATQRESLPLLWTVAQRLADPAKLAEVCLRQATYARLTSDYPAALTAVQQAVAYAQQAASGAFLRKSYQIWGRLLWHQGNYGAARTQLQHALALARATQQRDDEALCCYDIGVTFYYEDDYPQAQQQLAQAQAIYRQRQDRRGESSTLIMFGNIARELGDYSGAQQHYEQARQLCQALGWRYGELFLLGSIGNNAFELGDYAAAQSYHQQAIQGYAEVGNRNNEALSLAMLGLIHHLLGDQTHAQQMVDQALTMQQAIGDKNVESYSWTYRGHILTAQGDWASALAAYQQADALRQTLQVTGQRLDSWAGLAHVWWRQGEYAQALQQVARITAWLEEQGVDGVELPIHVYLTCYRILQALAPPVRGQPVLAAGYRLLHQRANAIHDEAMRQRFLTQGPFNRELLAHWQAQPLLPPSAPDWSGAEGGSSG